MHNEEKVIRNAVASLQNIDLFSRNITYDTEIELTENIPVSISDLRHCAPELCSADESPRFPPGSQWSGA